MDYEHAGVAIAIHQRWLKDLEELKEVSGRIIVLKSKGAGGDIAFLSACAPTAVSTGKDKDDFDDYLAKTVRGEKDFCYVYRRRFQC